MPIAPPTTPPKTPEVERKNPDVEPEIYRLNTIFDRKNHRSKRIVKLKSLYAALKNQQFPEVANRSSKTHPDDLFADYDFWISASAHRALAAHFLDLNQNEKAVSHGKLALNSTFKIETYSPFSPFFKTLSRDAAFAELLIARGYSNSRQWAMAERYFERGLQRLQNQSSLGLLDLSTIQSLVQQCHTRQTPSCNGWIQRISSHFARSSIETQTILKVFPDIFERLNFPKPANNRLFQSYKGPDLDQQAFEMVLNLYWSGKYSQAIRGFRLFLDDYPRSVSRFRAKYWLAEALSIEKSQDKAEVLFAEIQKESPLSYYGLLAALQNHQSVDTNLPPWTTTSPTTPAVSNQDPALFPSERFHLSRAEGFIAEGAQELAVFELKEIRPRELMSNEFLLYLALLNHEVKNFPTSFQIVTELIQRGFLGILSPLGAKLIFPVDFFDLIQKYADTSKLDPILVLSLIKQESAFASEANSSAGAVGLMQLMPSTAAELDKKVASADLLDPEKNISIGTKYLKKLLTKFDGNIVLALAAYNAGPTAVDRWLKDISPKRGILDFIESIPYRETRDYVGSIMRNYYWYSTHLKTGQNKDLSYFWPLPKITSPSPSPAPTPNASPTPQI
jgi:tetratricopeptide (TPR) repeat protein